MVARTSDTLVDMKIDSWAYEFRNLGKKPGLERKLW